MRRTRNGFSLVELLVVTGIIALLLAILLPVLSRVRRMAFSTECLAHLQQLDASYQMYLNANHNHSLPLQQTITQLTWWELLQPYNGNIQDTLLCPEATDPGNMIGGAFRAWGPERTYWVAAPKWIMRSVYTGSYGINSWLFQPSQEQRAAASQTWLQRAIEFPARQPDRVPVFGDCIMAWGSPDSTDTVPSSLINPLPFYSGVGPRPVGPRGTMAYFCVDRHFHAVNMVFLDGHAQRVDLADLWKLRWNNRFIPSDVVIP